MDDIKILTKRIEKLEAAVFSSGKTKSRTTDKGTGSHSLPDRITALRDSGFFKQPKTAPEVQAKLQSSYACEVDRVVMALLRFSKKKLLRVTSKEVGGKKFKAYVW